MRLASDAQEGGLGLDGASIGVGAAMMGTWVGGRRRLRVLPAVGLRRSSGSAGRPRPLVGRVGRFHGLAVVVSVRVVVSLVLFFGQRRLLYQPEVSDPGVVGEWMTGGREVTLRTADGLDLAAWVAVPGDAGAVPGRCVLYAPGNAGARWDRASVAGVIASYGYTVLLLEYRGYAFHPGQPHRGRARS